MVGEYSLRGGILDVFPAESAKPVRIEFFGDQIESIRRFDVESQRSVLQIEVAALLPLLEYPKSRELFHELAEALEAIDVAESRRTVSRVGVLWRRWPSPLRSILISLRSGGHRGSR